MNFFTDKLDRLKPMLRVSKDQEVAAALGLSKTAFSERKKRDSFPELELRALARARPELNIDVDYVMSGVAQAALEMINAAQAGTPLVKVSGDELQLLQNYRSCSASDKEVVRQQAAFLAARARPTSVANDGRYPQREEAAAPVLHDAPPRKRR